MSDPGACYHSDSGPTDGPIRLRDIPDPIGILSDGDAEARVGRAHLVGWSRDALGPIAAFRLLIGPDELPGLFTCDCRRFLPLG